MAVAKKILINDKYGFPNFTKEHNNVKLCESEKIIISDIWAFWDYVVKKNAFEKNFMSSLLEQAKFFYKTAENSPVKSQPLLYYYAFLNFAKILINIEKKYGKSNGSYMHGIGANPKNKFSQSEINIKQMRPSNKNVSAELANVLDETNITSQLTINVKEMLSQCVGIHRTYCEIYNIHENFCRLDDMKLFKYGKDMIFEASIRCDKDEKLKLQSNGYNIEEKNDEFYWIEQYTASSNYISRKDYYNFSRQLKQKGIWYYISSQGCVSYISTATNYCTNKYCSEFIIYNTMFYLGSITRYHPYLFDQIFSDKEQWLMSEFLTTQPKQFLYSATAKILSQPVLRAYSDF